MRSVPLSTRDGLWASCGRRLCTGPPVADGCAQGLLWQTAVHRASCGRRLCTAPAAPLGSPACRPPCGRARSPLTCGRSPQIRLSLSFSSFFSLFSFPSLSFPLCFFLSSSPPSFSLLLLFSLSLSPQTTYWYLWGSLTGPGVLAVLKTAP